MSGPPHLAGPARPLQRARARDVPAIVLATGRAMAARPFGARTGWVLAVAGWPFWVGVVGVLMPHVWHLSRSAMVTITPPDTPAWSKYLAMLKTALLIGLVGIPIGVLDARWPPGQRVVIGCATASLIAFALVYAGLYPGRRKDGPKVADPTPAVQIGWAASPSPGSGILHATAAHLHTTHPGRPLELVARDTTVAGLYAARWGLTTVTPGTGRMTGLIP